MIRNRYISRNIPSSEIFENVYYERLAAKKAGDKGATNALKLVLNTTYGATLNRWNDLFDPLMARSVCISGQLYLLELCEHVIRDVPTLKLLQCNTDGLMVSLENRHVPDFMRICEEWEARTGFTLEYDEVQIVNQANVNNYAVRMTDGHEKVKGGYLVRGTSKAGAFSVNNNATIVADALRAWLLDGTPVEQTVMACDDPAKFQLIAKAGSKYSCVYQVVTDPGLQDEIEAITRKVPMQRCNRVFATTDESLGRLYKVKAETDQVAKIESLPEHCLVSNAGMPDISEIDKSFYVQLARRRAADFESKEREMATTTKKATASDYKSMNVYQKLAAARLMVGESGVTKSGVNDYDGWTYMELGDIVPVQNRVFAEVELLEQFTYHKGQRETFTDAQGNVTVTEEQPYAISRVINVDDPNEVIEFCLPWLDIEPIVTSAGKKKQNAVQLQGSIQTYLRRYIKMQVLDLAVPDKLDDELGAPEKTPARNAAASKTRVTSAKRPTAKKPSKPATAEERGETAKKLTNANGRATQLQLRQLRKAIKTLKDAHGGTPEVGALVAEIGEATDNLKGDVTKKQAEEFIRQLGELKERLDGEGEE